MIDFTRCIKPEKTIRGDICIFMGFRTITTCYCMLDSKLCYPFIEDKQKEISKNVKEVS